MYHYIFKLWDTENRTSSRTFSRKCIIFFIVLIPFQAILLFSGKIRCRNKSHLVHCFPAIKSCSQGQSEAKPLFLPLNLLQRLYIKNSLTVNSLQGFSPYTQEIFLSSLPILSLWTSTLMISFLRRGDHNCVEKSQGSHPIYVWGTSPQLSLFHMQQLQTINTQRPTSYSPW